MENNINNIELTGKIVKFPSDTKAVNALKFLESVKVNPSKLWYIIIEDQGTDLKMVKYNRSMGVNLFEYTKAIKEFYLDLYKDKNDVFEKLNNIIVEGENEFSIIKNIPTITLENNQTLISKITSDLIKLLSK
jgi:hypothetical protein